MATVTEAGHGWTTHAARRGH